jgi:hypothetical protein
MFGEYMETTQIQATKVAELGFATGKVGQRSPLATPEQEAAFAQDLADHTETLTQFNTADCGDDRPTIRLADGTTDPEVLRSRIVSQLFGGLGLSTTKALVAADAAIIRDAKSIWQAYEITVDFLSRPEINEQDGGHAGCGASASVESSVAKDIRPELLVSTMGLFVPMDSEWQALTGKNAITQRHRLDSGFYGNWDPQKHLDFLVSRFPANTSYLQTDPHDHETGGHHASAVYAITNKQHGFAKNRFTETTGRMAFGVTVPKMYELAHKLSASPEEERRIILGFAEDTLRVGSGLVTKDMPIFAEAS